MEIGYIKSNGMMKLLHNSDKWMDRCGIELVYSSGLYERYPGKKEDKIDNKVIGVINNQPDIVTNKMYSFISPKDYYIHSIENNFLALTEFLCLIEKLAATFYLDISNEYTDYILERIIKPEGCSINDLDWIKVLDLYKKYNKIVEDEIKAVDVDRDSVIIFQSREPWEIVYERLCDCCFQKVYNKRLRCLVKSRFAVAKIPKELCLSHKSILFRKF